MSGKLVLHRQFHCFWLFRTSIWTFWMSQISPKDPSAQVETGTGMNGACSSSVCICQPDPKNRTFWFLCSFACHAGAGAQCAPWAIRPGGSCGLPLAHWVSPICTVAFLQRPRSHLTKIMLRKRTYPFKSSHFISFHIISFHVQLLFITWNRYFHSLVSQVHPVPPGGTPSIPASQVNSCRTWDLGLVWHRSIWGFP